MRLAILLPLIEQLLYQPKQQIATSAPGDAVEDGDSDPVYENDSDFDEGNRHLSDPSTSTFHFNSTS